VLRGSEDGCRAALHAGAALRRQVHLASCEARREFRGVACMARWASACGAQVHAADCRAVVASFDVGSVRWSLTVACRVRGANARRLALGGWRLSVRTEEWLRRQIVRVRDDGARVWRSSERDEERCRGRATMD